MLRDTKVRVLEDAPPWARTDLINSRGANTGHGLTGL